MGTLKGAQSAGHTILVWSRKSALIGLVASLFSIEVHAQITWDGGGSDNNWTTANNWNPNGAPGPTISGNVTFSGSSGLTPYVDSAYTLDGLLFASGAGAFTIGGNQTLTIKANGISNNSSNLQIVNTAVTANLTQSWNTTSTGGLSMGGAITIASSQVLTSNATAGTTITIGGAIVGSGALTISGGGTTTLFGTNSYTGNTTLSSGSLLNVNSATALGGGASSFVVNGGTINNTSGAAITLTNNNAQLWGGNFTFTGNSSLNLGTGTVNLSGNRSIAVNGSTLTVGGVIADGASNFGLTKTGAGALTLSGNNTFGSGAAGLTLSGGTLNLNDAGALGKGTFTIAGGTTIDNTSGAAITSNVNNNLQAWNGNFTFTGTNNLNLGTGNVTLSASPTVTVTGGNLTVGGALGGGNFSLTKAGAGILTLTGNIATGSGGVNASAGTLSLSGVNTYTGNTTVSSGATLNINSATAIGAASSILVINGGTIDNTSGSTKTLSNNNAQHWDGDFTFSGTGALNLGTGAVTLGANRTLTVNGANALTVGGVIDDGASTFSLTKTGTGTLTLTGNNTYGGTTTVNGGTLGLNFSGTTNLANIINFSGNNSGLALGGGTLLLTGNTSKVNSQTFNGTTVNSGASTITLTQNGATSLTIALGNITRVAGGTLNFSTVTNNTTVMATTGTSNSTGGIIGPWASVGTTTSLNYAAVNSNGRIVTAGANGTTAATAGGTNLGSMTNAAVNYSTSANNTLSANRTGNTLRYTGGTTTTDISAATANRTLTLNGLMNAGTGTLTIKDTTPGTTGGLIIGTNNELVILGNAQSTVISAPIRNGAAAGSVTFTSVGGAGSLTLSGSNAYTGGLTLNAGTLNLNNAAAAGTGAFTINGGAIDATAAGITLNNNAQNWNGDFSFAGTNNLNLGTGNVTLGGNRVVTTSNGTLTVGGSIIDGANNYGLTKAGAGTLTLTGANTYDGTTTINAGTLQIGAAGTTGSLGAGAIVNNADFVINRTNAVTFTNAISGTGNLTQAGTGTTTLSGNNTYTGATSVTGGVLELSSSLALGGGSTGSSGTTVSSGATLQLNNAGTVANLTTGGGLTITGTGNNSVGALNNVSGTSTWANNITLGGNTTVGNTGTALNLGNASPNYPRTLGGLLNPSAPVDTNTIDLGSSTLTFTGSGTTTVNSRILGTGGNVVIGNAGASGTGTVHFFSLQNTYTGTTTINDGTLWVDTTYNTYPNDPLYPNYFGVNGPIIVGDGSGANASAILKLTSGGNGAEVLAFNQPITINTDGKFLAPTTQSIGALTMSGNATIDTLTNGGVYLNGDVVVNATANSTATIVGTGAGNGGVLSLTVHNGNASTTDRLFTVNHNATNSSDLTISASVTNGSLTKTGNGTMTLAPNSGNTTANTYGGTTTINDGILRIQKNLALGAADALAATGTSVTGTGTLQLDKGAGSDLTITSERLALNTAGFGGAGALRNMSGNNTWAGTIFVDGSSRINSDANLLTLSGSVNGSSTGGNISTTLTIGGSGNTTLSGSLQNYVSGNTTNTISLNKDGTGKLIVSGSNNFSGPVDVQQGVLSLQSNNGFQSSSNVTVSGSLGAAALELNKGAGSDLTTYAGVPLILNGTGISNGGALRNISGNNTYQGPVILATDSRINSDANTLTLNQGITSGNVSLTVGGAANTTVSGNVNLGTGTLTKDGAGTATFSGSNSTVGNITMSAGTLNISSATTSAGTYTINSGNTTFSGLNTSTGIVSINAGTTTFSGGNTTTGAVTVNTGTLNFNMSGNATTGQVHLLGGASSTINVGGGATVHTNEFDSAASTTLAIASGGTVIATYGTGTTTTFSGQIAGNGGTYGTFEALGAGTVTFDHSIAAVNNVSTPTAGITLVIGGTSIGSSDTSTYLKFVLSSNANLQFYTIHITGDTVLDFGNSSSSILNSANLIIDAGVKVSVINWVSLSDVWYATSSFTQQTSGNTTATASLYTNGSNPPPNTPPENQIAFTDFAPSFTAANTAWVSSTAGAYNDHEIRPVPEPATYGVIFLSGCVGAFGLRRYLRRQRATRA